VRAGIGTDRTLNRSSTVSLQFCGRRGDTRQQQRKSRRQDTRITRFFGALGGTRTPTILLTATSRQRVYQFRHERLKEIGAGFAPGSTAPM
jgi:hypothetical protein